MRAVSLGSAASTIALALLCACDQAPTKQERNLVLVVVDTLRADRMSLHGYERETTPKLDAFAAARGVVFERARSTAPWTKPSMASIFTGLDPRQHRVQKHADTLHSSFQTLARAFGEGGWQTHGIQSNPYLLSLFGFDSGFIAYEDSFQSDDERGTVANHDGTTGHNVNARALAWLDERDAEQPFFLYVHHYEPHHMYLAEEPDYMPVATEAPDAVRREQLAGASMDLLDGSVEQLTPADVNYLSARYDSEILFQDQLLGELFDGLKQRGLFDETVIVITSDHGEEFREHGDLSHHNDKLYDELLRVPLVIAAPNLEVARSASAVSLVDLGRSLLDLCGLAESSFPGKSFAGAVAGRSDFLELPVVAHGLVPASANGARPESENECLIDGRWKLVRNLADQSTMLFDLKTDPLEQKDLAASQAARARELGSKLDGYLGSRGGIGGPLPAESPEIIRRREEKFQELEDVMRSLGYLGDDPADSTEDE